jgi:UDP-N-acetyl-D-glucosamine dehydrogenase
MSRIQAKEAKVAILGMGYVGLPLALAFVRNGFSVLAFDIDRRKVDMLNEGKCYIEHLDSSELPRAIASHRLHAYHDFAKLAEADAILLCVPTPLTKQREPEMKYVRETTETVLATLRPGQLVVLESTTYPGTTDELCKDILERSGLKSGQDFFLAFSPEREDPGNKSFKTATIPKVLGGVDPVSGDLTEALYAAAIERTVRMSSARVAEAVKLTENIFRGVNIALVNELKMVFDRMGIDVWEVLDGADTKPFGFMRFNPGPGWGGHCIPLDPFYLSWKAREYGVPPKFIELAGEVNVQMPDYVMHKVMEGLNQRKKALNGAKVLMLGVAYKKDVDDCRESPAFPLMDQLLARGAELTYHDPHIPEMWKQRAWPHIPLLKSEPLTPGVIQGADVVLIATDHTAVDYDLVLEHAQLIVDTRGRYRGVHAKVVKA